MNFWKMCKENVIPVCFTAIQRGPYMSLKIASWEEFFEWLGEKPLPKGDEECLVSIA